MILEVFPYQKSVWLSNSLKEIKHQKVAEELVQEEEKTTQTIRVLEEGLKSWITVSLLWATPAHKDFA